jgi:pyruvate/2-oxoglutarate dehydrogenase complex dihydrolipoamide acyltransferase (E2) component
MIDHGLVDGAPAARFLKDFVERLKKGVGIER